jgi:TolB-like protein/Flp pilus assembly protein TadD
MGEVYRARDSKLKREVAVKVLPQSLAADADALARFEREALAVAALSHPNILAIFDFGTHEGTAYAVTELLEGETLRGKLDAGPIPQKQAVEYALQIAKGLSAAHERGVVHRDLKPENLFVSKDSHLKILDFGLAKRVEKVAPGEETSAPTASGHTQPGTVMGTVGYMSPEQVRGIPLDHRSDIFSFGAILYELLSGRRAFSRPTAADTMSAILKEEPPELSQSGRNISPALDHVVRHCLEKDRDNRFQSAKDIAFALSEASGPVVASGPQFGARPMVGRRTLVAAVVLGVLAAVGTHLLRRSHQGTGEAEAVKRVAVLPFENLGSPEDDYFADGIADAVRGKLTSVPGIEVIARGSSVTYKKTTKSQKNIADELQAPYLLTATVRWQKSGGASRVQVSPELVEVKASGAPASKWQQPFDAVLTDVFQVQSEIARQVAQALGVALGASEEKRIAEKPTQNLAAYDAFLKGEDAYKSLYTSGVRQALGFYEQAVALDPGFAQAWARLAEASAFLFWMSTPSPGLAESARQAAEKAVALAPDRPEGYEALGLYLQNVLNDDIRAQQQYDRAFRLGPLDADHLAKRGGIEERLGQWDAAVEDLRQAEHLDPRSVRTKLDLGTTLSSMRRFREARDVFDHGLALAPANILLIEYKAETFLAEGDLARARAVVKSAPKEVEPTELVATLANNDDLVWVLDQQQTELLLRLTPSAFDDNRAQWAICLAQAYALKGNTGELRTYAEEARKAFQEQLRVTPQDAQRHVFLGLSLAYLGRKEEAIREGERAVALRPVEKNPVFGAYYRHLLVRIYILVGEPEKALDKLESLMTIPNGDSPGWLKIDPNFDPLRSNPRFQRLVASAT